jgi:hypothetical protein
LQKRKAAILLVGQRAFGSIIALMVAPIRGWPGHAQTTFGQGPRHGERTMIIETPILVLLGMLAIGATVWWVYS